MAIWKILNDINEFKIVEQVAINVELANYLISFSFRGLTGSSTFLFLYNWPQIPHRSKFQTKP